MVTFGAQKLQANATQVVGRRAFCMRHKQYRKELCGIQK